MKGRAVLVTILGVGWFVASGCAFVRGNYGEEVRQVDVSAVKKGVSTRSEVGAALGAPDRIVEANGHEIFHYYHYDMKTGLILVFSRTNIKSEDIFVFFDRNGVVEDVVSGKKKAQLEMQFWPFGD